jgi:hypothetical protein
VSIRRLLPKSDPTTSKRIEADHGPPAATTPVRGPAEPELQNAFEQNGQGALYALLVVRHMADDPNRSRVLHSILGAMFAKGRGRGVVDHVAGGFIGAIAEILINADRHGVMDRWARASADHLASFTDTKNLGRGYDKRIRESLARIAAARRAFVNGPVDENAKAA